MREDLDQKLYYVKIIVYLLWAGSEKFKRTLFCGLPRTVECSGIGRRDLCNFVDHLVYHYFAGQFSIQVVCSYPGFLW